MVPVEYSNLFVVLMGVGTVFVGLICIVLLVTLMGWLCRKLAKKPADAPVAAPPAPARLNSNGGEFLAAISAAIAEELGADISAIRITSIKRV